MCIKFSHLNLVNIHSHVDIGDFNDVTIILGTPTIIFIIQPLGAER